jgi:hypothetical protein
MPRSRVKTTSGTEEIARAMAADRYAPRRSGAPGSDGTREIVSDASRAPP